MAINRDETFLSVESIVITPSTARLLIGDVAFETARELENCRARCGEGWDDEEHYPILENLRKDFPDACFEKQSFCAGVFVFGYGRAGKAKRHPNGQSCGCPFVIVFFGCFQRYMNVSAVFLRRSANRHKAKDTSRKAVSTMTSVPGAKSE